MLKGIDGEFKLRASRIVDQIDQSKVKKAMWKVHKGMTLGTGEKFLLYRVDTSTFTRQEARNIDKDRTAVAKTFEQELRGRRLEELTDTEKALLRTIPQQYLSDPAVKAMKRNLPQEQ